MTQQDARQEAWDAWVMAGDGESLRSAFDAGYDAGKVAADKEGHRCLTFCHKPLAGSAAPQPEG